MAKTKASIVTQVMNDGATKNTTKFMEYLTPCKEPGVNDFSVRFHRDAYDYCDGYYVKIKVGSKYNMVFYDWSQYSGYHYKLMSSVWFNKIYDKEQCRAGLTERYKNNHWEYDYNSGRFCCGTVPTLLKVETDDGFNFLNLKKGTLLFSEFFKEIVGEWKDYNIKAVRHDGTEVILTSEGGIKEVGVDYKAMLEKCKGMSYEQVRDLWVAKGRPCVYSSGLWNSDDGRQLTTTESMEKIKSHRFGKGFYSLKWILSERLGCVALCFKEYSLRDME